MNERSFEYECLCLFVCLFVCLLILEKKAFHILITIPKRPPLCDAVNMQTLAGGQREVMPPELGRVGTTVGRTEHAAPQGRETWGSNLPFPSLYPPQLPVPPPGLVLPTHSFIYDRCGVAGPVHQRQRSHSTGCCSHSLRLGALPGGLRFPIFLKFCIHQFKLITFVCLLYYNDKFFFIYIFRFCLCAFIPYPPNLNSGLLSGSIHVPSPILASSPSQTGASQQLLGFSIDWNYSGMPCLFGCYNDGFCHVVSTS